MRIINVDDYEVYKVFNFIDNGNIDEVIEFAKKENIWADKINRYEQTKVLKIKERLDKEGLNYEIVRPE